MTEAVHPTAFIFVGLTLMGALMAVALRNIVHAIFGLAIALFGIAGLFIYLSSPFLAVMQVLIYVGGISVAMVFAVMVAYTIDTPSRSFGRAFAAFLPSALLFGVLAFLIRQTTFKTGAVDAASYSIKEIGKALLTHYNLVFEALSIILLLAIMGAIVIARRPPADDNSEGATQ